MKINMNKKTTKTPRNGRWPKGTSGNPSGRPVGSRNKSTVFLEELINAEAETLVHKTIELALKGDTTALRLCLDRIYPPRKERTIDLDLADSRNFPAAVERIFRAVGEGRITPGEAEVLVRILESRTRIIDFESLARRVSHLEEVLPPTPESTPHLTRLEKKLQSLTNPDWVSNDDLNGPTDPEAIAASEAK